ncbi:MAG: hypothetical protein J0L75_07150 [Spirochaetes bacterium]|nr:hypothetical protein [Spirochaetota bacterium]
MRQSLSLLLRLLPFLFAFAAAQALGEWNFESEDWGGKTLGKPGRIDGIAGKALFLDGSGSLEAQAPPLGGDRFTLEAWVRLDQLEQQWAGILTRWGAGGKCGAALYYRGPGNGFRFEVKTAADKTTIVQTEKEALLPGTWYHLAGVYDGTSLTLYLNGNPFVRKAALTLPEISEPVLIGRMGSWSPEGLKGALDEVRLLPAALGADEVLARFRAHAKGTPVEAVVADFEDVGSWRAILSEGAKGRWYAGHVFLCSTRKEAAHDEWAGVIRYDFTEAAGPYRLSFRRAKIMENRLHSPRMVSFWANPKDYGAKLAFEMIDAKGKKASTEAVGLEKNVWKEYRLALTGPAAMEGPVGIHAVTLVGSAAGRGEIFLDDLTLSGETTDPRKLVSLTPIYRGLGARPGEATSILYRLRNQTAKDAAVSVAIDVTDFFGKPVSKDEKRLSIPAHGSATAAFSVAPQPIGHYRVGLSVSGAANYIAEDSFAVFNPNGARINRSPMWFGAEDQEMWEGEEENLLHKEWIGALGVDLVRFGITGPRFEQERGFVGPAEGFTPMLKILEKYGIDAFICYTIAPEWTGAAYGAGPSDYAAFGEHVRHLGAYLNRFPNVKYFELWNEPDGEAFKGGIAEYLAMQRAFYTNLKAVSPKIGIATGGLMVKHPREKKGFTKDVYQQGKGFYDLAAFHSHGRLDNYVELQGMVEGYLAEAGVRVPICNTESGERSLYDYNGYRSQAATLVKKIAYAKSRSNTEFYSWFTVQDYWDMDPGADDSFGLVTSENRPKPAFVAYNELIRRLANTVPDGAPELDPRLFAYRFKAPGGERVHVVWPRAADANVLFSLETAQPVTRVDLLGREETLAPEAGKVLVSVSAYPIYLITRAPVAAAKGDASLFTAPAVVAGSPGEKADFTVTVKSPWTKPAQVELKWMDEKSAVLESQTFSLAPGASRSLTFSVVFPAGERLGLRNHYFTLNAPEANVKNLFLPQSVVAAYKIARLPAGWKPGDAWPAKAPALILDSASAVHDIAFDPNTPLWKGPKDLSVKAVVAHDDQAMVFLFDVVDDVHVQAYGNGDIWRGDCVQVALSSPEGKLTEFSMALGPNGPLAWCHVPSSPKLAGLWDIPIAVRRAGDHTVYEARVPFEKLGMKYDASSPALRFAFLVNENDGKGRIRWIEWFGGIGGNKDPSLLGFGRLE